MRSKKQMLADNLVNSLNPPLLPKNPQYCKTCRTKLVLFHLNRKLKWYCPNEKCKDF